ncbi:MAG: hypothetical protein DCC56_01760 [Anaerolineae bacterium]|nr:MAG: hypothetical protein DCC56_01760 [Anaerolineae bacterium]
MIFIALGAALFLGAAGWFYLDNLVKHPAALTLPERIAGLSLTDQMTGAEAAENFINLHNQRFPITSGAIGFYGGNQTTIWAAGVPFNFMVAGMVNSMRDKISEGKSPFTPTNEYLFAGRTVYELEGMGQRHFYFQSNNLIVWLAADPSIADEAIEQILEAYP